MVKNHKQNILYECFEDICKIFQKHDVSFSLGDGLRPGSVADASDEAQFAELKTLGELTKNAWEYDVQVMIEGPGHIPMDQIEMQVEKEKEMCYEAPFYTLGPLVTDIAPGYDHITSRHRRGDDRLVRRVHALLRHAQGAPGPAESRGREGRHHRLQDRRARGRYRAPPARRARPRRRAFARPLHASTGRSSSSCRSIPETARSMHDETLPEDGFKDAHFCSMCGPKFCSMNISAKVEAFTADDAAAVLSGTVPDGPGRHQDLGIKWPPACTVQVPEEAI